MSTELNEKIDRLQLEVSQLREMAMMQTAILQIMAIKSGIAPVEFQALSPLPIPSPFDILDLLKAKDQAAGL
jgi:hypothetical protein